MVFYVYILKCFKDDEVRCFYVGQTRNVKKRMREHHKNSLYSKTKKYTGRFDRVKIIWLTRFGTREEALKLESYLKTLTHTQKAGYMELHGDNVEKDD